MTSLSLVALLWVSQVNSEECVSAYGMTRCGYDCIASYGQIACAQTPWGACRAAYGQVQCFEGPPVGRRFRRHLFP